MDLFLRAAAALTCLAALPLIVLLGGMANDSTSKAASIVVGFMALAIVALAAFIAFRAILPAGIVMRVIVYLVALTGLTQATFLVAYKIKNQRRLEKSLGRKQCFR